MRRVSLLAIVALIAAIPAAAQYWSFPAKTANTDVTCTNCPCNTTASCAKGKLTVGYPASLGTYVGRYLDSQNTNDYQAPFRTARARNVVPMPSLGRVYFIIGSAVVVYDQDTFFQRLAAGEKLGAPWSVGRVTPELALSWNNLFYAETGGWFTPTTDGQERLYSIDVDDLGYVYMAYNVFSWGIAQDVKSGGMPSIYQYPLGSNNDDLSPNLILSAKDASGKYYAFVGDDASGSLNVYDTTNRANPTRLKTIQKSMLAYAKTSDATKIGVRTGSGTVEIYRTEDLVAGGSPLTTISAGGVVHGVASDGTNFYVAIDNPGGLQIATYAPDDNGNGYHRVASLQTSRSSSTIKLQYGGGFLVASSIAEGGFDLRLFNANVSRVSEVNLALTNGSGYYFKNYYVATGLQGYTSPHFGDFFDSGLVKSNGHTYLIVTGYGLGDAYDLAANDSLNVRSAGSVGTLNANRPAGAGAGPFYGDPIGFTAATTGAAQTNIQWDFGNPEAATVAADPNVMNGVTGQQATHRYSGITSVSQLPLNRVVKATSIADATVNGSTGIVVAAPSVAIGIAGVPGTITAASQLSAIPIVAGDKFVDASDGSVESHFDAWTIDTTVTKALPNEGVSVGPCAASHSLSFDAHYGPYTGTSPNEQSLSDLPIGIHSATYSVRPFIASIATTSTADTVNFTPSVRVTTDTSVMTAAQVAALQYRWELLNASNAVVSAGPSGTGTVPVWSVAKSALTSRGIRAHLVLTSPTPVGGSCAGMASAEAFTQPLNVPDPTLSGDCTAGGPPCSFRITSASSVNTVADGWTYVWGVSPNEVLPAPYTTNTFNPTFTAIGSHVVSCTVTNAIGSITAQKTVSVTQVASLCPTMVAGNNVFIGYAGSVSQCSHISGQCNVNEAIAFYAGQFNYDYGCGNHTFLWDFGDNHTGSGLQVSHTYAAPGTYTVKLTITNPIQTVSMTQAVPVGGGPPPPQCATMIASGPNQNVLATYAGPDGCSATSGTPCAVAENVTFYAGSLGYDYSCANHTFTWKFGDGTQSTTNSTQIQHAYSSANTYTAQLTISNGIQTATLSVPVAVGKVTCPAIKPGVSVFASWNGPTSGCSDVSSTQCSNLETVNFTAGHGLDYDFSCATHTFSWDFGDGSAVATGQQATHQYAAGTYNLKLNVTVNGVTTTIPAAITVHDDNPISQTCNFDFTSDSGIGQNSYVFVVTAAKGAKSSTFNWDFGDGTIGASTTTTATHTYLDTKIYTVTLTVPKTNCFVQHPNTRPHGHAVSH